MGNSLIEIGIVGSGPRGISVLERLCANASQREPAAARQVRVHVIDPHLHRGSAVWRTDQAPELLMNTVAAQITMFADDTVDCAGPVVPGPSLHEWARLVAQFGEFDDVPQWVRDEARTLGPDSYPSRALYGHYLRWVLTHIRKTAPDNVLVELHPCTATTLTEDADGTQRITLSTGDELGGLDAVVLTQGHVPAIPTEAENTLAEYAVKHGLDYVPPVNPADVDLDFLAPGQPTVLRGLGLNFFDYLTLLTVGRGGGYSRDDNDRLVYHPSGGEPRLIAGSRRGIPYHARGENQKGPFGRHDPLFLTQTVIAGMQAAARDGRPVNFRTDVWPLIDREVRAVYYAALITERYCGCDADLFLRRFRMLPPDALPASTHTDPFARTESLVEHDLLERFGIGMLDRWDWQAVAEPYAGLEFADHAAFTDWLIQYLGSDVVEAKRGNVSSPLKAALDVLRDLRNEIRLVVDHGGLSGDSYRDDLQRWYTPLNAFLSIGPPARRIEELVAVIESGVLAMIGPGMQVRTPDDDSGFLVESTEIPGAEFRATALVEARLPEPDIRRTTDPLLGGLLARGEACEYRIPIRGGGHFQTGGLAVTPRPYHLIGAGRRPHPRRFAFGVPTETVHWVTAAGIRPGVNSVILADADAVANASLAAAGQPRLERAAG